MIHPSTELRLVSPHVGYGVFASRTIPKGSLVFVQDPLDIELTPEQYQCLDETSRQLAIIFSSGPGSSTGSNPSIPHRFY